MTLPNKRWHEDGNCNNHPDPELWHYQNSMHSDEQELQVLRSVEAITLCRSCPVKEQCLTEGMEDQNIQFWGGSGTIWGGLLMSERQVRLKRRDNSQIGKAESRHSRNVRARLAKLYG